MPARALVPSLLLAVVIACSADRPFPYLTYGNRPPDASRTFATMPAAVRRAAAAMPRSRRQIDAVPATLTASDGTGLGLERLRARAVVDGPLAFTELELTFANPTDRQLEGRFELSLPPGAAISRFAMKNRGWMEAEMVARHTGQEVYESHLHRQVDPALLEHVAGNQFAARVFPIAPAAQVQLIVSYSHELADPRVPYRLPLVGLPRVRQLEVSARVGGRLVRHFERDVVPTRDFTAAAPAGRDGLVSEEMAVARVETPFTAVPDRLRDLLVVVDTSASSARDLPDRAADIEALAREVARRRGPDVRFGIVAFDQTADLLFDGRAGALAATDVEAVLLRQALGASDLETALARAGRAGFDRVLLMSDGVATAGSREAAGLLAGLRRGGGVGRIDALATTGGDPALLRQVAARGGRRAGIVLEPGRDAAEWMRRLELAAARSISVRWESAEWVWPERLEGLQPGDHALVFARVARGAKTARIQLDGGTARKTIAVPLAGATRPLLARELAQAEIARLMAQTHAATSASGAERDARVVALSLEQRVLTPLTALLVLESEADYGRFGLDRRALSDILTVDATGLRLLHRSSADTTPSTSRSWSRAAGANGTVAGVVVDRGTGAALTGVTVVATSTALQGTKSGITQSDGTYVLSNLPPGRYVITFYYADVTVKRTDVTVRAGKNTPVYITLDQIAAGGEVIEIKGTPNIDATSSSQGIALDQTYTRNIPVPGRSFESSLGAEAGSAGESLGVSFSGSTSLDDLRTFDSRPPPEPLPNRTPYTGKLLSVMRRIERGDSDAALVEALTWRRRAPWDVLALVALGEALEARGSRALAARAYGSIIDLFPSRAEMIRFAAGRLARLGPIASALAIEALERAVALRPDHPSGHRMLAYALVRAGRHRDAIEVLIEALHRSADARARLVRAHTLLADDAGLIAADWLRRSPESRGEIERLLDPHGILVPLEPSVRFVLTWENDATDLDLHVARGDQPFSSGPADGVERGEDVSDGWGPELAAIPGAPTSAYHLWVEYTTRAMMGTAFGQLDIVAHDGHGRLRLETRPFVVMTEGTQVDLGRWK